MASLDAFPVQESTTNGHRLRVSSIATDRSAEDRFLPSGIHPAQGPGREPATDGPPHHHTFRRIQESESDWAEQLAEASIASATLLASLIRAEFFAGCSAMAHRLERHDYSYREQRRVLRAAVCAAADELLAIEGNTLSAISSVRSVAIRALDDAAVRGPIRDVVLAEISCAFISAAYLTDTPGAGRHSEPSLAPRCPTNDPERS